MNNKEAELVWYEGMVKELGLVGVGELEESKEGFTVKYEPSLLTIHQAQDLVSVAQRDGFFKDTYIDVEESKIMFRKGNVK